MTWTEIRRRYPNAFILLGDLIEEKISATQSKIVGGKIVKVSQNAKEIRDAYQICRQDGKQVIYALPTTPEEFIVEDVPFMGRLA